MEFFDGALGENFREIIGESSGDISKRIVENSLEGSLEEILERFLGEVPEGFVGGIS